MIDPAAIPALDAGPAPVPRFPLSPPAEAAATAGELVRTPDDVAVIQRLHALGWGSKRIAAVVGCARNTVKCQQSRDLGSAQHSVIAMRPAS